MTDHHPTYAELPDGDARSYWGADDRFGCLRLLTEERTLAAAKLVRTGRTFSLNAPINGTYNNPSIFPGRAAPKHYLLSTTTYRDDWLDGFFPQGSSQWDHFRHSIDPRLGRSFGDQSVGIEAWAERGIVGRGVLLDVARSLEQRGDPIDWRVRREISAAELRETAREQGVEVEPGTILLVRVGWQQGYAQTTFEERVALGGTDPPQPGLAATPETAALLWDWGVAAIGLDNPAMEAWPSPAVANLHRAVLVRLGVPVGEFWLLDALAEQCASERRYEFLFTSAPLNIIGGVGSSANALAIM